MQPKNSADTFQNLTAFLLTKAEYTQELTEYDYLEDDQGEI